MAKSIHVAIVGAGVIGICSALELQKRGFQVTLFDPEGIAQGASKGNAGHFATEQVFPLADASLLPQVPKMLLDPLGPFRIRLSYLFKALPWFARFLLNMTQGRYSKNLQAIKRLNEKAIEAWQALLQEAECENELTLKGSLLTFEADTPAIHKTLQSFKQQGVSAKLLNQKQVQTLEPALSDNVKSAILFADVGHTVNPESFCTALANAFISKGGRLVKDKIERLNPQSDHVEIKGAQGNYRADKVIVAAGAWSKSLANQLGYQVPLDTERGYHIMLNETEKLQRPVASFERKFIMTPMDTGLRLAGTVEFAGLKAEPDYKRAFALIPHAKHMLKTINADDKDSLPKWMGFRPSLPDSLPVIGQAPNHNNIYFNFGHQHLGLTWGAISGRLIAQSVNHEQPELDLTSYSIQRFN